MAENPKFYKRVSDGRLFPFTQGLIGKPGFIPFDPDKAEGMEGGLLKTLGELEMLNEDGSIDQKKLSNAKLAVECANLLAGLGPELDYAKAERKKAEKKEEEA